ncbi:hypothetical protein EJ06DRAFT_251776 [Trichodelitschia bisporula]|uniref:Uncharacterized protein n=1 Tax=Trichodelitschia bisporula TaxID=703511 RepID=A0A6G1HJ93_9PEZI|nr:hypothetical protein EJ06DRAFT_251776 [Trichodelitschia bisporula]
MASRFEISSCYSSTVLKVDSGALHPADTGLIERPNVDRLIQAFEDHHGWMQCALSMFKTVDEYASEYRRLIWNLEVINTNVSHVPGRSTGPPGASGVTLKRESKSRRQDRGLLSLCVSSSSGCMTIIVSPTSMLLEFQMEM